MTTLREVRIAIRKERRAREWTIDKLRDESGADRKAIHKLENIKKYPHYAPEFETVLRLVRALGMSMAAFFEKIETTAAQESADAAAQEVDGKRHRLLS